jgi:hypothetical protein
MKIKNIFFLLQLGVLLSYFANELAISCKIKDEEQWELQEKDSHISPKIYISKQPLNKNPYLKKIEYNDLLRLYGITSEEESEDNSILFLQPIEIQGKKIHLLSADEENVNKIKHFIKNNNGTYAILENVNINCQKIGFGKRKSPSSAVYKLFYQGKSVPSYNIEIKFIRHLNNN